MRTVSAKGQVARLVALLLASLLLAVLTLKTLTVFPSFFVEDDAWFYLEIGYNLGTLHRSTFDGINSTSGYHLAWGGILGILSAGCSLFSSTKTLFLIVAATVYLFLGSIAAEYFGKNSIEKLVLLFFVFFSKMLMESQLLATLLLIVGYCFLKERKSRWVSAVLVLIPLVRIDAIIMMAPLAIYYLTQRDYRTFTRFCVPVALGTAVHFLLMFLLFGRLASVASLNKAYWLGQWGVGEVIRYNLTGYMRYKVGVFFVLLCLSVAGAATARHRPERIRALLLIAGPALFVVFHILMNAGLRDWYLSPALFLFALVLLRCGGKAPRRAFLLVVCMLVLRETRAAYFFYADDAATLRTERVHLFLDQVRNIVPEDEAIYQVDGSGFTGFFARRKIVNGDGLVNSYGYLDRLKADNLRTYLKDCNIRYVITTEPVDGKTLLDFHGLRLTTDDADRVADSGLRERYQSFMLWRVRKSYFDGL